MSYLKVFLCHASSDKPAVRELYNRLSGENWIDPWLDSEKLLPGQDWELEIEKAVEASHIVLVCLSNRSVTKEGYIQKELRYALDVALNMPEGTIFIIPLRLEECETPRRLRTWQWVDYFPPQNLDTAYSRLINSLKLRADRLGVSHVLPASASPSPQKEGAKEKEMQKNEVIAPQKKESLQEKNLQKPEQSIPIEAPIQQKNIKQSKPSSQLRTAKNKIAGYLPNDVPPKGQMILFGFQHVLTMFPATVLVAALCGFHISTVLTISGLGTIVALLLAKWQIGKFIPLFYGSSFSYIAAYQAIAVAMTGSAPAFGVPLPDEVISTIQAGIVVTGILNILFGFLIRTIGKANLDILLPPIVTGSVAAIIGFGLAFAALGGMAGANYLVACITLFATILFSVYLQNRGFLGMIPVLLGAIVGYTVSLIVDPNPYQFQPIADAAWFAVPHITFPSFTGSMVLTAIFSVSIMAIATVPESTAHLYQISLYVDRLAEDTSREKYELDKNIGFNLVLDGIDDTLKGLTGATAGTNYGENNSLMAISRNYSGPSLIVAGLIAILLGFVDKLSSLVQTVPLAVSGGLAIYLFGVIGMQGIALMQEHKVSMFDPRNLAIGAVIMIVGIGGNIGFPGGFIPMTIPGIFPSGLPAIATAAIMGIAMNLIFVLFKTEE